MATCRNNLAACSAVETAYTTLEKAVAGIEEAGTIGGAAGTVFDEHVAAISANREVSRAVAIGVAMDASTDEETRSQSLIELLQTPLGIDPSSGERRKLKLLSYSHPLLGVALMDDVNAFEAQQQPVMWGEEHEGGARRRGRAAM